MTQAPKFEAQIAAASQDADMMVEELAHRRLPPVAELLFGVCTIAGIALVLNQLLNLQFFAGITLLDNRYLFLLAALLLGLVFLAYPARRARIDRPPTALDWALFAAALGAGAWFAWNAQRALASGWEYAAPREAQALAAVFCVLVVEATRRAGGIALAAVVLALAVYPVYAALMPGPIAGLQQTLPDTVAYHVLSNESAFGIPMRAFGELVVGFIVFGVALNWTGGGRFFNDLAFALVGRFRGGAAQVGVISSALQGSISGSVISNVITSGVVTIPAMVRTGFSPRYAAGVEAVASTGGVLMPPVMGSTAFVMAAFLGRPYGDIALAAVVPALLFYFGLAVQIDGYAARRGLGGLSAADLPRLGRTVREGWPYALVFAVLIHFMLRERDEALAPFYATAVLLAINQFDPRWRFDLARLRAFIGACGRALGELVAILLGVGLIVGAFSVTGLAGTLANDLVFLAGDRVILLLLMGALTSFVFGMGMTATACYIFLAITLAPPLVRAGLDPMAVHMFIFYWGMVSFITPPVALGAFAAATIARTGPFGVGLEATRLGAVIYFVPFFFVLEPALLLRGDAFAVAQAIVCTLAGIVLIAAALQGWLLGTGRVPDGPAGWAIRAALGAAGIAIALPGGAPLGLALGHAGLATAGAALAVLAAVAIRRFASQGGRSP